MRWCIAATVISLMVLTSAAPDAEARRRSCLRGGAELVTGTKSVRVVRIAGRPDPRATFATLYGCRVSDGRRFKIGIEYGERDFDVGNSTTAQIVDDRYIGVVTKWWTDEAWGEQAEVWDARRAVRVRQLEECGGLRVVFMSGGAVAYACDGRLQLVAASGTRELDAAGVAELAASWTPSGGWTLFWLRWDPTGKIQEPRWLSLGHL